jgi:hypothetical protein
MAEDDRLEVLTNIINRSNYMCPTCREIFNQLTWELLEELERVLPSKKRTRRVKTK